MEKLIDLCYDYEFKDEAEGIKYEFVSVGTMEVPKRVTFTPVNGLSNYYNLGLTNISIDEEGNETASDMSRENNINDDEKVMLTAFLCALDFLTLDKYKDAKVIFAGNTVAKQRYYTRKVSTHLEELSKTCTIKGGRVHHLQVNIDPDTQEKIPIGPIPLNEGYTYTDYTISDARSYQFITFEVKDELKE